MAVEEHNPPDTIYEGSPRLQYRQYANARISETTYPNDIVKERVNSTISQVEINLQ